MTRDSSPTAPAGAPDTASAPPAGLILLGV